jgi:DNA-binding IclR family transcriptional regulator
MRNMLDRAMHYMERDPSRAYTLTELRRATGIAIRSQYRLSTQLLDSGMVERDGGSYRIAEHLLSKH